MKRIISILVASIFTIVSISAATSTELKFNKEGKEIEILNFNDKGRKICEDNVRFLNQTASTLSFEVYGKKDADSEKEYLCSATVKSNDSKQASPKKDLDNFKYIYIICQNGDVDLSKVTCEHSDLYCYISSAANVTEEAGITDFSKYQKVVQQEGVSKNDIYEGILQGCVKVFNKSTFVIEYKDKDTGVIKGKAQRTPAWVMSPTTYYFVFTFEAREGRYRATFDDLEYDTGTMHVGRKTYGESEFNEMRPIFDDAIHTINECIKTSNSGDDW